MGLFKDCGCGCNGEKQEKRFIISLILALTFFIISNPQTYMLTRGLLGQGLASPNGCPVTLGLLVHTLVFFFVAWGVMNIKR
jgi:hypothetical protein